MSGLFLGIRAELDPSDDDQTVTADNVEIFGTTFDDDNTSVEQSGKSRGRLTKNNRGGSSV